MGAPPSVSALGSPHRSGSILSIEYDDCIIVARGLVPREERRHLIRPVILEVVDEMKSQPRAASDDLTTKLEERIKSLSHNPCSAEGDVGTGQV